MDKKILITGGAGFIGSHTTDALIEKGASVVIVDNLSTGRIENLNPEAKFYNLNITDPKIDQIIENERPSIIYHFAFFVLVPKSVENPLLDLDSLTGSIRMLKKVKELGGLEKFIFASSGFLYGNNQNLPVKETEPISPVSPYVITKRAIENYLEFYGRAFGIPSVILRYATVYGPRQVTGAMADYIRRLSLDQQAEMWGDGTKTRDYVHIDDVIRANLLALDVPNNYPNPVFNVGTGKETTLNTIYQKIAYMLGKSPKPIYNSDRPGEQVRYCLDYSKIKKEMGWEPKVELDNGLSQTVRHFLGS